MSGRKRVESCIPVNSVVVIKTGMAFPRIETAGKRATKFADEAMIRNSKIT
jgi:hypothetical protein